MISNRLKLAIGLGFAVGAGLVGGFAPVVRYEAGRVAQRYGGALEIAQVIPTWHGARLRGVDVALSDVPSVKIHLDEVEVQVGSAGRKVELRGGTVSAVGPRERILREAEAWRARLPPPSAPAAPGAAGIRTEVAGLSVSWKNDAQAPTESVSATEVAFTRGEDRLGISAAEAAVVVGRANLDIKKGRIELVRKPEGGYRVASAGTEGVEAQLAVAPPKTDAATSAAEPPSRTRSAGLVRAALLGVAQALDAALEPSAAIQLRGVHARVRAQEESINLGPGLLSMTRDGGKLVVDLAPELRAPRPGAAREAIDHEEPLTFRLAVPLREGPDEITADIRGGPIWLSTLGVKEGDFGLFDVNRASVVTRSHLVLPADGETVRLDGEGKIDHLSIRSAALSDEPVAGLELAFRAKGEARLDGTRVSVAEGEVDLGAIRLVLHGEYERAKDVHRVRGTFEVPITACQSMLDSIPKGMIPKLAGLRAAGSFALKGKANIDTAKLDRAFSLDWDTGNTCRVTEAPPEINVERFQKPFTYTAYDADGRPFPLETGPGTPTWSPLSTISKFMEVAVLTTEDGGFRRHHGFDAEAIKNSIRENIRKKRFVRGASTISMQLAKNLYLDRGKNLSRKLQEAILTMYLEQALTKEQILELYFNVVELGPKLYGIGPAARSYFSTSPADLSLGQALYISSILPSPKIQHFGAGGAVSPNWMDYLRKLMKIARQRDHLTDEELDEGLRETVIQGSPAPHRDPSPHPVGPGGPGELPDPTQGDAELMP
ncbi:MAG: biosynthetic peptidoglycan transglycosylase [Byssovorax sp.]